MKYRARQVLSVLGSDYEASSVVSARVKDLSHVSVLGWLRVLEEKGKAERKREGHVTYWRQKR